MWAASFYGFWEYWELYHKVTFDMVNKLIYVNPDVTDLDIKIDVYSDWKEWYKLDDNSKSEVAIRTIGGDPTIGIERAGDIYFLINGWRITYNPSNVRVTGVLFSDDYESAWLQEDTLLPVYPTKVASLVNTVAPVVDIEGVSIPTAEENATAVRTELTPELTYIDVAVSSRASQTSVNTVDGKIDNVQTTADGIQTTVDNIETKVDAIIVTIGNMSLVIDDLIKYQENKTLIDPNEFTMTIYEDNGTTPLRIFDLQDANGVASITDIYRRIPRP